MLRKVEVDGKSFQFVPSRIRNKHEQNIFSVVVGKNGTGKSRLLRSIVSHFLKHGHDFRPDDLSRSEKLITDAHVEADSYPDRIICVSMNPFDKFPLPRRSARNHFYSYLGLRQLSTNEFGFAYLSKIIVTLIEAITEDRAKAEGILDILRYLEYVPEIDATFQWIPSTTLEEIYSRGPAEVANGPRRSFPLAPMMADFSSHLWAFLEQHPQNEKVLMDVLKRYNERPARVRLGKSISITARGIARSGRRSHDEFDERDDFLVLVRSGLLRLRDISLWKHNRRSGDEIKLSEASSGEQTVLMSLMGIASQIRNNSLICIDEPEVCLHPEWQERYIELLHRTFSTYRGCHFLLATHSPQIVAQLPTANCYVMQMESGRLFLCLQN